VIFRDGKAYTATWRTTSRLSPIQFTDANGEVFALKPGNTWMVLLGTSSYEQNLEGNWTFNNYLP
jgi:hypothetical protein